MVARKRSDHRRPPGLREPEAQGTLPEPELGLDRISYRGREAG